MTEALADRRFQANASLRDETETAAPAVETVQWVYLGIKGSNA